MHNVRHMTKYSVACTVPSSCQLQQSYNLGFVLVHNLISTVKCRVYLESSGYSPTPTQVTVYSAVQFPAHPISLFILPSRFLFVRHWTMSAVIPLALDLMLLMFLLLVALPPSDLAAALCMRKRESQRKKQHKAARSCSREVIASFIRLFSSALQRWALGQ